MVIAATGFITLHNSEAGILGDAVRVVLLVPLLIERSRQLQVLGVEEARADQFDLHLVLDELLTLGEMLKVDGRLVPLLRSNISTCLCMLS